MTNKYLRPIVLIIYLNCCIFLALFSQTNIVRNPAYGPDSLSRIQCASELSNMAEYMKINLPDYALGPWRKVLQVCPASSKNIYIIGAKIFSEKVDNTKDPALQKTYFDTLMMVYDQRIKYFGEEGNVLGRKGKDLLKYNTNNFNIAYRMFKKSVELETSKSDNNVLIALMETGVAMFKADSISSDELLSNYLLIMAALKDKPAAGSRKALIESCVARINTTLTSANINDCAVIEKAFTEKANQESNNLSFLNVVINMMEGSGCENADFYGRISENAYILEKAPERAYKLAKFYIKKEKFREAMAKLADAIEIEQDPGNKAQYYYQMAIISTSRLDNPQEAVGYAEKAIELNQNWGDPYLLIAAAYVEGMKKCSEDDFVRSTVYWVAVDKFLKAKSVDPSIANKANDMIAEYSKFFPNKEDIFFRSLTEGGEYTIDCWINQKTTIRARK